MSDRIRNRIFDAVLIRILKDFERKHVMKMTRDEARARVVGSFPVARCKHCGKLITDEEMQELFPELGGCFSDNWRGKSEYCDCRSDAE